MLRKSFRGLLLSRDVSHLSRSLSLVADDSYNRWRVVPPAVLTHLSIGSVYSWSLFNQPLSQCIGVLSPSSGDWDMSSVVPIFSTAICAAGLTAALAGPVTERYGPRASVFAAGLCWGGGLALSALGVEMHSLPLVYLGYGVLGGIGVGLAYAPPVATLMRWFPDRKGLASGMAIGGFGAGAMVAAPVIKYVMEMNFTAPTFLGPEAETVYRNGRLEDVSSGLEVVIATCKEISSLGLPFSLEEGAYLAGTGNNGAAAAMLSLGVAYTGLMCLASLGYRVPRDGWVPEGYTPPDNTTSSSGSAPVSSSSLVLPSNTYVSLEAATRTPQFAQIWTALFLNTTAGIAVLGVAKTLMSDVFGSTMPTLVDASFCGAYVAALSAANGLGRLGWATISDKIGRKSTYTLYFALGIPLYLSVPYAAHMAGVGAGMVPLTLFTVSTVTIISMYGGGFSVAPAYLSDLFGSKEVGPIYGRLLTAWSAAGLVGPTLLSQLRKMSEEDTIKVLASNVDPDVFRSKFSLPVEHLQELIDSKAVTIAKLLPLAPEGTIDPTPFLYDSTMATMSGMLALGLISNMSVRPVDPKLHITLPTNPTTPPVMRS